MKDIRIKTTDYHTAGEPLRIIEDGFPQFSGKSILEIREHLKKDHDELRRAIIFEPRGHQDMYACLPTAAEKSDSKFGMVFLHNEGYSTMCGHAVIAMGAYMVDSGKIDSNELKTGIKADTPAGQVLLKSDDFESNRLVSFENVPSFVVALDQVLDFNGLKIRYHLAFGGAFYAIMDAGQLSIEISPDNGAEIRRIGMELKDLIHKEIDLFHPEQDALAFLYGVIFTGPGEKGFHSQNVCVFAEGEIDRSPTGTGVSARAAVHFSRGEIDLDQEIRIQSLIATEFSVKLKREVDYHGIRAVIPEVRGRAFKTGMHEFIISPGDPLRSGFLIR